MPDLALRLMKIETILNNPLMCILFVMCFIFIIVLINITLFTLCVFCLHDRGHLFKYFVDVLILFGRMPFAI